jgi:SpoVK/Ycf46/Vps4 family AAA+-type ATPase
MNVNTSESLDVLLKNINEYSKKRTRKSKRLKIRYDDVDEVMENLCNIKEELSTLNEMVGIDNVKETILEHVLYLAQDLSSFNDMNHVQICGEPGTGKSTLAEILGQIYAGLGFLENGEVIKVTRTDMIGDHLGSTAIKTESVLESCIGNVLLIDEAYSFGCHDKKDSFAKESIDCINQFLSEHRGEILCIIAGYEQDIKDCFFAFNRGLERRFPWKYRLEAYDNMHLKGMFEQQIKKEEWELSKDDETKTEMEKVFSPCNTKPYFNHYGGDTEILFVRCKIAHSNRIFKNRKKDSNERKVLNHSDIRKGFENLVHLKKNMNTCQMTHSMMYC